MDADVSEEYLRTETLSLRGLLYAYRGRFDEAAVMTVGVSETAVRRRPPGRDPGPLPPGRHLDWPRDDVGAIETCATPSSGAATRRKGPQCVARLRGDRWADQPLLAARLSRYRARVWSSWPLSAHGSRPIPSPAATSSGNEVRQHALFGAAVEQLASTRAAHRCVGLLAGRRDRRAVGGPSIPHGPRASTLRRQPGSGSGWRKRAVAGLTVVVAAATFEELGAHPYIERTRRFRA